MAERYRDRAATGDFRLHRVVDGVWIFRGYFSNSAIVACGDRVVVVDTQVSSRAAQKLRRAIRNQIGLSVECVINTHHHGDHMGGNQEFADVPIHASELTNRWAVERDDHRLQYSQAFGLIYQEEETIRLANETFAQSRTLSINQAKVEIMHLGKAETEDAVVAWFPAQRVVACGDSVATVDFPFMGTPFLDEGLHADGEWVKVLKKILELKPQILIPGHGPAIVGEAKIRERILLIVELFAALISETESAIKLVGANEHSAKAATEEIVALAESRLQRFAKMPALRQKTLSLRFGIYRSLNSLLPSQKGRGWWYDLRRPLLKPVSSQDEVALLQSHSAKFLELALTGHNDLEKIARLKLYCDRHADDIGAQEKLIELAFLAAGKIRPTVDASELMVCSSQAARALLQRDSHNLTANLYLACAEVIGAMVLAHDMSGPLARMTDVVNRSRELNFTQKTLARFFYAKAYQMVDDYTLADQWYRMCLPFGLRWLFVFLKNKMYRFP